MTYGIRIDIDTRSAERAWDEGVLLLAQSMAPIVREALRQGSQTAKLGDFKDRTGDLRQSIRGVRTVTQLGFAEGELQAGVSPDLEYASFVEYGTRRHIIEGNPTLSFKVGNRWIHTRRVRHPGTAARKFMAMGAERSRQVLVERIERAIERLTARMKG